MPYVGLPRRRAGEPAKRAVPEVAARYGLPHRQAYRLWLEGEDNPAQ
ncbi:MAG: hypothetical protein Q7R32_08380 [Dehalococcoidia bacterium]|nr:hypothetical protein [Dehalococcoidia bacterium]